MRIFFLMNRDSPFSSLGNYVNYRKLIAEKNHNTEKPKKKKKDKK